VPKPLWMDRVSWPAGLLDLYQAPYVFALAGPIVNHFHCVWIDERFQNALRCLLADHVFVRGASIVQELGRSGSGLFLMRLYQERLCIGSRPPSVKRYDVRGRHGSSGCPQRLSELHRNSFNAFSVILGLNCSGPGSISRANLVNQTRRWDCKVRQTLTCSVAGGLATIA